MEFSIHQKIKIPSFETMIYLCDPNKIIERNSIQKDNEEKKGLTVASMIKNGKYKDLVKLLLVDEKAPIELEKYFSSLEMKLPKYPNFMETEEKLAEIK